MKTILSSIAAGLCLMSCQSGTTQNDSQPASVADNAVEVIYFHTDQRCATCVAIESNTIDALQSTFADKLANGDITFNAVNIADNEQLADKYEVAWSSLILIDHDKQGDEVDNLTTFAFANARNNPEEFKRQLTDKIQAMLND